jgi:DNA-binding transcriptional regulator PaaX
MSQHRTTNGSLSDAILKIMKPSGVYTIQHLARRLSALSPSNAQIRAAIGRLIGDGKVQVSGFFMRSATYRLSADGATEHHKELTDYAESLRRGVELANLARRR